MEKQTPIPSPHPLNQGRSKTRLFPIFDLGGGGVGGGLVFPFILSKIVAFYV